MATSVRGSGGRGVNTTLVGAVLIVVAIVATVLSYSANRGLPFVPTYDIKVAVPDAAELVAGSSEVRIGGARVGIVKDIRAIPARPGHPAYAELSLGLAKSEPELPVDSRAEVRPRSILGAKFLELTRGRSSRRLKAGDTLPIAQASAVVGIDEAFKVFEPKTRRVLQRSVVNVGDGLAGRGSAFNETITSVSGLIAPLQGTLRALVAPQTRLGHAIVAADAATAVLAPVAPELERVLGDGATTLAALDAARPALDRTLAETPATLQVGTRAARTARPVLDDATVLARALRPAAGELPAASRALRGTLTVATPILGRVPALAGRLDGTVVVLDRVARRPATTGAIQRLRDAVASTATTLQVLAPAQLTCNILPLFFRNVSSVVDEGDTQGAWFDTSLIVDPGEAQRQYSQGEKLNLNPVPANDATQCETGNEPYVAGRHVGSPDGNQAARTEETTAPADATARGRAAGLVVGGAR